MSDMQFTRNQFTFYRSFLEAACQLPKSHRGEFLFCLLHYGIYGFAPQELRGAAGAVFTSIRPILDAGRSKALARGCADSSELFPPEEPVADSGRDKPKTKRKNKTEYQSEGKTECKTENPSERQSEPAREAAGGAPSAPRAEPFPPARGASLHFSPAGAAAASPAADTGGDASDGDAPAAAAPQKAALRPCLKQLTRTDYSLRCAVQDFVTLWAQRGEALSVREQETLAEELLRRPPWERTAAVHDAIAAQTRGLCPAQAEVSSA